MILVLEGVLRADFCGWRQRAASQETTSVGAYSLYTPPAAFPTDKILYGVAAAAGEYAALGDGSPQASTATPPVHGVAVDTASASLPGREILSMFPFTSSL